MVGEGVSIRMILALLIFHMGSSAARDFSLVGYLPEWRHEGADFDRLSSHLSHLILFSAEVRILAISPKNHIDFYRFTSHLSHHILFSAEV